MLCESSELGDLYKGWIYKTRPGDRRQETLNTRLPAQAFRPPVAGLCQVSVKAWPRSLGSEIRAPGPRRGAGGVPAGRRAGWLCQPASPCKQPRGKPASPGGGEGAVQCSCRREGPAGGGSEGTPHSGPVPQRPRSSAGPAEVGGGCLGPMSAGPEKPLDAGGRLPLPVP